MHLGWFCKIITIILNDIKREKVQMKLPDKAGLFCYCTLLIIEVALIECIKEPIGQCLPILSFISAFF